MKRFILVLSLLSIIVAYPIQTNASPMPCSVILEPVDKILKMLKV
ncbi:hypothetical protein DJ95_1425 [Bacillus atrophaeus subsp. globigii]|nr:hypothetical protein DJ95_1425 [Bacillus atrophaeus subsp. globigii]KFK82133.1 hypothetical protein DK44_2211 [Bacillus atrophaeus]